MAEIGSASLTIVPKFDDLSGSIKRAFGDVDAEGIGKGAGSGYSSGMAAGMGGLAKSGAIAGAFSAVTSKAMTAVASSVGDAASRFDTLNNYPRVMQSLGYSAEDADASLKLMSDRLTGLPTSLDSMVSTVQGITAVTGDVGEATEVGLAFNDMMLASGSNTQLVSAATEQFRQMLAKGKPELQDWKSIVDAAPGQMDALAKSMLGPTANANDLYTALGGGGGEATLTMDDLMAAIVRLDQEGGDGMASFADQARNASNGVQTSAENIKTAVVRGMADVMQAIGQDTISGALDGVRGMVSGAFEEVSGAAEAVSPVVKGAADAIAEVGPKAGGAATALLAFGAAYPAVGSVASAAVDAGGKIGQLAGKSRLAARAASLLGGASALVGGPWKVAAAAAVVGVGLLATKMLEAKQRADDERAATQGVADAVQSVASAASSAAGSVDVAGATMSAAYDRARDSAAAAKDAHQRFVDVGKEAAQSVSGIASSLQEQNGALDQAAAVIDAYAGKTNLSAAQQQQLRDAVDQVNAACGTSISYEDALAGKYEDEQGQVHDLRDEIMNLVAAREQENNAKAYGDTASELKKQSAAARNEFQADVKAAQDSFDAFAEEASSRGFATTDEAIGYCRDLKDEIAKATILPDGTLELPDGTIMAANEANNALMQLYDSCTGYARAASEAGDAVHGLSESTAEFEFAAASASAVSAAAGDTAQLSLQQVAGASQEAVQAFVEGGPKAELSLMGFSDALAAAAADDDSLRDRLASDPDAMAALVAAYDGTAGSLEGALSNIGESFDGAAAAAYDANGNMHDFLSGMSDDAADAVALMGESTDTLEAKLSEAGVSTGELKNVGRDNFDAMVQACGGDIDKLVAMIELYNGAQVTDKEGNIRVLGTDSLTTAEGDVYTWNGTELVDKDGNVAVEDTQLLDAQNNLYTWNGSYLVDQSGNAWVDQASLVDAQGNLYTWNGSYLADQDGEAAVEDTSLVDAQGHLYEWDGSSLDYKGTSAEVDDGSLVDANAQKNAWNSGGLADWVGSATINIVRSISEVFSGNAEGGIRTHADGGVRYHAPGAVIATRAVPLDVVGEAGAEAIVPLTNRRYSQPFADIIAEGVQRRIGDGNVNVYLDNAVLNDDAAMQAAALALLNRVMELTGMYQGVRA